MLRNYFTTAIRYFLYQPVYSAINLFGLVLGLTCSIFIFLWILDELSYDRYHADNDRVYKVMWNNSFSDGRISTHHWTSGLLAGALKDQIPEVEQTARVSWAKLTLFKFGEKANYEPGDYADKTIFEVLNLPLIEGDKRNPIPDNNSVAISRKMAKKYFEEGRAVGNVFRIDNLMDVRVTAVFEDVPENSTESFEFILPFELYIAKEARDVANWDGEGWQYTFIKLQHKDNLQRVDRKMADLVSKLKPPSSTPPPPPFLFPMEQWRLYDNFVNAKQSGGRINYVVSFGLVAILILIIACINFMNLATARSVNRSREVGIRKVAGASRGTIIKQFLIESVLQSVLSMIVALLLVYLLLPLFNGLTEKQISLNYLNPVLLLTILGVTLLTGIIAGSYPAFFLSSFKPASVLKGNLQSAFSGAKLRKALVVFQFALSIIIIICTLVVNRQINFMQNKNLGFDKTNVITLDTNDEILKNFEGFKNKLLQNPSIKSVAMGDAHPMEINGQGYYDWHGKSPDDDVYFNQANCDYEYLNTLGFTFIEGRNFSPNFPADSNNFIITEEAANYIGFANPIGQRLQLEDQVGQIIGVIKDFNNLSIQEAAQPTVFGLNLEPNDFGGWATIFVRYNEGKLSEALENVRNVYKNNSPGFPIQYGFIDQSFERQFEMEKTIARLSYCFTFIAIAISCLGLFGLAAFSAERRAKEIGVRKVLGASVSGLIVLLCRDFSKLVVLSILLGSPIAYYIMVGFLDKYPYHTSLTLSMFVIPAIVMLAISLSIVTYQSIKAAIGNPVKVLRSE